jgi:hypothetical protein
VSPFGAAEVEDCSLGCSRSRRRFRHRNSALDCQLWSTRRTNAFAKQDNGLLERCCAMQCRMQDAKCEESRGFRKGRKKGRAGPRPGSTECWRRYRYGHHSGLLRPGGILGCQPVWHRSAPALAGASQRQAKKDLVIAGSATCVCDRDPVRVQRCSVQAGTSADAIDSYQAAGVWGQWSGSSICMLRL